ncbi:MAG: diguanylate cyclase [Burkholderiaceae bacterium]
MTVDSPVQTPPQSPRKRLAECLARGEEQRLPNPKQAFDAAQEALALARQINDPALLGAAERLYGRIVGDLGQPQDGLRYTLSAVRRFEELGDNHNIVRSLAAAGMAYVDMCSFDDALAVFERAERMVKQLNDQDLELRVIGNMSLAYSNMKDFASARRLMQRVVGIAQALGKPDLMLRSNANLGHIELEHGLQERESGNEAAAREHFERARDVMAQMLSEGDVHHSLFDLGITKLNLGIAYRELGDVESALTLLQEAREIMQRAGNIGGVREADMHLSLISLQRGQLQQGIAALRAFARSEEPGITPLLRARAWRQLSAACEQAGDLRNALDAFKAFHTLDQAMLNERVSARAAALAMKMDIERAQIEADVLRIHAEQLMDTNTQLSEEASVLSRQANEDGLTSLSNRRHFDEQFPKLLEQMRAIGGEMYVALADLDHFKQVNDQFSHSVGDEVLRQVSAILRAHSRADDLVARYGGEEFILVLQHANADQALAACQRLRSAVEHRNWPALANGLAVTMSIGLAKCDPDKTPLANIEAADALLYHAKDQGRNQVCV